MWANPAAGRGSARWSAAHTVLLDEINDHLQRTPSLGHVVLDEAQDLSPMQLRAVGRRCSTGSATVLGDLAQGTTQWATDSWESSLAHLGKPDGVIEILERGFRVPASVIDFAARLLPSMAPGLGVPVSVRNNPGQLEIVRVDRAGLYDRVAQSARQPGSVGVIAPDAAVGALSKALTRRGVDHGVLAPTSATWTIRSMSSRPRWPRGLSSTASSSSSRRPSLRPNPTGAQGCVGSTSC